MTSALLFTLLSCTDAPDPAPSPSSSWSLSVVYSGNNDGEIEPCG